MNYLSKSEEFETTPISGWMDVIVKLKFMSKLVILGIHMFDWLWNIIRKDELNYHY